MEWILYLPVLFFSVVVHEFCHGWAAYNRGDDTAEKMGRLTLNPLSHMDPFGTVFLPALCFLMGAPIFGWAKPVPVNPARLHRPSRDTLRVAFAGPLANFALAAAAAVGYKLAVLASASSPDFKETLLGFFRFTVGINLFLAFFNLIPVHPLDGSKVLAGLLPRALKRVYERHAPYGALIILMILFTHMFSAMVLWPSNFVLSFLAKIGLMG